MKQEPKASLTQSTLLTERVLLSETPLGMAAHHPRENTRAMMEPWLCGEHHPNDRTLALSLVTERKLRWNPTLMTEHENSVW